MNLAHAPSAHRTLGMPGHPSLGMTPGGLSASPFSPTAPPMLHQRSPFAIQELLGLSQHHHPSPVGLPGDTSPRIPANPHQEAIMSVSSYMPRSSLPTSIIPSQAHTILAEPHPSHPGAASPTSAAAAAAAFNSWRNNLVPFGSHHPSQHMLNLGGSPGSLGQTHLTVDTMSG